MFFSTDAINENFSQGRMVNDATPGDPMVNAVMVNDATPGDPMLNAVMKIVIVEIIPHLCLFEFRNIECNEEICYDYGVPNLSRRKVILFGYCNANRYINIFKIFYIDISRNTINYAKSVQQWFVTLCSLFCFLFFLTG